VEILNVFEYARRVNEFLRSVVELDLQNYFKYTILHDFYFRIVLMNYNFIPAIVDELLRQHENNDFNWLTKPLNQLINDVLVELDRLRNVLLRSSDDMERVVREVVKLASKLAILNARLRIEMGEVEVPVLKLGTP